MSHKHNGYEKIHIESPLVVLALVILEPPGYVIAVRKQTYKTPK